MTREKAIDTLKSIKTGFETDEWMKDDIKALDKAIEALEKQKVGHWIRLIEEYPDCDFEFKGCSVCRTHYPNFTVKQFRYCPNCGAKMEGE